MQATELNCKWLMKYFALRVSFWNPDFEMYLSLLCGQNE